MNQKLKRLIGSAFSDTSCKSDFVDSLYFMTESYEKTDVIRSLHFLLFTMCVWFFKHKDMKCCNTSFSSFHFTVAQRIETFIFKANESNVKSREKWPPLKYLSTIWVSVLGRIDTGLRHTPDYDYLCIWKTTFHIKFLSTEL